MSAHLHDFPAALPRKRRSFARIAGSSSGRSVVSATARIAGRRCSRVRVLIAYLPWLATLASVVSTMDRVPASFTSSPFTRAVVSIGVPQVRLRLSHTAPTDLVLFAKVWDVAPDGSATLIHRLAAPARIPNAALGQPVRIKLLGFAHRFARGHSVRLTLCTTDQAYYNNQSPDTVTFATGPGATFRLPTR